MSHIKILIAFLTLIYSTMIQAQEKIQLIYVGDPMCSWCYGIAPELAKVMEHYGDKMEVDLVLGGLRPYNKETILSLKEFLTHHWEDVSKASGQEFNYEILNRGDISYDTEPPSRATIVVREMDASKEIKFFKKCQTAFYLKNKNMHLAESYHNILNELDLDITTFEKLFHSDEMKSKIKDDFIKAGEMGVRGFPTLLIKKGEQYIQIANGFAKSRQIITSIDRI